MFYLAINHIVFLLDQDLLEEMIADSCFHTSQHIVSPSHPPGVSSDAIIGRTFGKGQALWK